MTTIPVVWASWRPEILARGYADQGFLEAALAGELWTPPGAYTFEHIEVRASNAISNDQVVQRMVWPDLDGCVFVFNGRTHVEYVEHINRIINGYKWVIVMLCGDEEWDFPWRELRHPNMKLYVMQARPEHAELERFIPGGWYPRTRGLLATETNPERDLDWSFVGQITHERRQEFAEAARQALLHSRGLLHETDHYLSDEVPRPRYFELMSASKVVPSPSGPYSVDCARAFEAFEAGCVPILDIKTAYAGEFDYWSLLFQGNVPLARINDWSRFPRYLRNILKGWPANANQVYAFWQQWKRMWVTRLHDDIGALRGEDVGLGTPNDNITVIVTTSPIPSHPSTAIIEQTIDSIRAQLPLAQIVVAIDGVRPEQAEQSADYHEYVRRLLWLTNFRWHNVVPYVADGFKHQANLTIEAMRFVDTPLMLFVEHDTPICGDMPWDRLSQAILSGSANVIQTYHFDQIHPDHRGIFLDDLNQRVCGTWLRRTMAWWQRPHLANAQWYQDAILSRFKPESRTMIEDAIYPVMEGSIRSNRDQWNFWRTWLYEPDTPSVKRHEHLNGRESQDKFHMVP